LSNIDVNALLAPIAADAPGGESLEYDPAFTDMEREAQGKAEQQIGDEIRPGQDPDWNKVRDAAIELFSRTKDLRVGTYLTRALLHTDGLAGLHDGLAVMRGLIESFWNDVYPQLDADDNNNPTERVNILSALSHPETTLRYVREAPLVSSRTFGKISLRDIEIATGQAVPTGSDVEVLEESTIDAAFMEAGGDELGATIALVGKSIEHAQAIDSGVTERVGTADAVDLSALPSLLKTITQVLAKHVDVPGALLDAGAEGASAGGDGSASASLGIRSRDDVVRVLDLACEYYRRNEPSSPVPLLLKRAKRLISKDFSEIVEDLTPAGMQELKTITGPSADE